MTVSEKHTNIIEKNLWLCERAWSERVWKIFAFSHSKTAISFNILLVLLILYLRKKYIFSGLKSHLHNSYIYTLYTTNAVPCYYLGYGVIIINDSIPKKNINIEKIYYASELRTFWHFYISKTAISFNILLVLQILCRYKWHACRLTCTDKFPNVPTKLLKSIIGGGGQLPPTPLWLR